MIFDTIQLQPYDGSYPQKALIKIFVDTAADLPALADFTDISPVCGSLAETVDTGDRYRLDSSGTWHLQPQSIFSNVYTKSETDALLAGKQDTLTFDAVPTSGSTNPAESGGIYTALQTVGGTAVYKMAPCTAADTLEYTGLSVTIPAASMALIGACDIYNSCSPQRLVLSNNVNPAEPGIHFVFDTGTMASGMLQLNFSTLYYNIAAGDRTFYLHAARYAAHATGNRVGIWAKVIGSPQAAP